MPVALPKPVGYTKKRQMLLTDIGGKWLMEKNKPKLTPMKISRPRKE